MEASFFRSSTLFLPQRAFADKPHQKPRPYLRNKASCSKICAAGNGRHDKDFGGRLVDENMVELRKRIRDIKLRDDDEEQLPTDWMKWEKQYHKCYRSDVCQLIGFLQIALMNTRPSTALGFLALVGLSVPTSVGMIMINLIGAAKTIFPGA
ncbi:uncharacterized protein [Aristolochia californica]|uniref:uncharacterized protein n=1 Tax=Aristolochia californica TaxID=171875 RepID=UPI0035DB9920